MVMVRTLKRSTGSGIVSGLGPSQDIPKEGAVAGEHLDRGMGAPKLNPHCAGFRV